MPTSANKDIVESKYSKYGENNMIIEGFVMDHEHKTDKTTATERQSHAHTIRATDDGHETYLDCFPVDEEGKEVMEIKAKEIPEFMKNEYGSMIYILFIVAVALLVLWIPVYYLFFNKKDGGNSS